MVRRRHKLAGCLLGAAAVSLWIVVLTVIFAYIVLEEAVMWVLRTAKEAVHRLEKRGKL